LERSHTFPRSSSPNWPTTARPAKTPGGPPRAAPGTASRFETRGSHTPGPALEPRHGFAALMRRARRWNPARVRGPRALGHSAARDMWAR
jgi:hypothetical protein